MYVKIKITNITRNPTFKYLSVSLYTWVVPQNYFKISLTGDLPGGPVVKNPPCNAGDPGLIPGQGTKIPHAVGQLSPRTTTTELTHHNYWARTPQLEPACCKLQSPRALEPARHNYRAHAPWSLRTTTREKPARHKERSHVPQLRPDTAQNK